VGEQRVWWFPWLSQAWGGQEPPLGAPGGSQAPTASLRLASARGCLQSGLR
jgi:hypothetical protein